MRRWIVALLTIVIYLLAQFLPAIFQSLGFISASQSMSALKESIYIQVAAFVVAAIIIIFLHQRVKNPMAYELRAKERKRYILPWILAGLGIVFIGQIIANLISIWLFDVNAASENTLLLTRIARQMPIFIVLIAVVGPILEEFVFRKVIFGEIYHAVRAKPIVKYLIAGVVSSSIFAIAHVDFSHFLTYFIMGMIFAFFYIYTNRLSIAIGIHMAQNALVTFVQLMIPEEMLQEMIEKSQFIFHLFIYLN
ncbi:intramembrane glutamic endopeptidase MroQ [Staphylococcus canis]|uniref:CPBP family intramembrane metalloprotease n=1 Tax=Staphylococcus canis TaxID=2724942 RepID=A0ABS0T7R5_9STAP|nr:type II CAAX endopeptidase family protein [Staphylococcus canis]MBI5974789.1 CPBP family intramembrane metalloprotease [Staphylococcus canis]